MTIGKSMNGCTVVAGRTCDAVDNVTPRWVAAPANTQEIARLIAAARTERLAVLCMGGKTSLSTGNLPRAFDLAIDTTGLTAPVETRPEDMTVSVTAGTRVRALALDLAAIGQRVAWDPGMPEHATVGGVLACDSTGGLAYGYGRPRDLVLGMTVVDGCARTLRAGGRVVKNVAGYDLVRLFAGSHGTLGIIVEATLRTHPLPEKERTLILTFAHAADADVARAALFASDLPLAALDLELSPDATWRLLVLIEGSLAEVTAQRDRVTRLCRSSISDEASAWASPVHDRADDDLTVRLGVAPADAVRAADDLHKRLGSSVRVAAHLGNGILRVSTRCASREHARRVLDDLTDVARCWEAVTVVERVPADVKPGIDIWNANAATLGLMRALKRRFDPDGVLAPGRFVGGI